MRRIVVPVLLLAAALAPAAQAQAPTLGVEPFPFPLAPTPEGHRTQVAVRAPCGQDVTLEAMDVPEWAQVAFEPPVLPSPPCTGTWDDAAQAVVQISSRAPALEQAVLRIAAHAGEARGLAELPLRVAFVNELDVLANETEKAGEPQSVVVFEVELRNHGNGNAKVAAELVAPPRGVAVPLPVPIIIEPGKSVRIPISAQTPYRNGNMDETDTFTIRFQSAYALDPREKGDADTVTFIVHTRGVYVPGPALLPLLGAAVVAFLLARRAV